MNIKKWYLINSEIAKLKFINVYFYLENYFLINILPNFWADTREKHHANESNVC